MKSMTVHLEISNAQSPRLYHPAGNDFVAYPRSEAGLKAACQRLCRYAATDDFIKSYRLKVYAGRVHYYTKDKRLIVDTPIVVK